MRTLPLLLLASTVAFAAAPPIEYGKGRELATLANPKIDESSGIACSRRTPGVFWTHNDSSNHPRVYAFNAKGDDLGTWHVVGARNYDWEDIASATLDGKPYLFIGDIGGNNTTTRKRTIYVVPEPAVDPAKRSVQATMEPERVIRFVFEDGQHDCESLAIDPTTRTFYLVEKSWTLTARVYQLPWPKEDTAEPCVAKCVAKIRVTLATGMDMSPDGLRAVVLTYGHALEYTRRQEEDWAAAFPRPGRLIALPPRRQGESICYGPDGKTLYLTSEMLPTPLWEVPVVEPGQ